MSLLLDNYTIELSDESNLAISKSIYDVIEPDKRMSSYTKTITIPSTAQNDKVLMGMFDVNFSLDSDTQFDPFFNPSKKAPCFIHTETLEQLTGYAQLTDITLNHYTNKVEYKLTIYGEIRDLFGTLSDRRLSDLDLSEFNHAYTKANIVSSWDYDVYRNGVLTSYSEGGIGYVYPQIDYGDDHEKWNGTTLESSDYWRVEHFRPWIYVKTIVDRIFQEAGFSYYSTFFNSSLFKKLIYQGDVNGLKYTDDEIVDRTAAVYRTSNVTIPIAGGNSSGSYAYANSQIVFNAETTDIGNIYNTSTGTFTCAETNDYSVGFYLNFRFYNSDTIPKYFVKGKIIVVGVKSDGSIFFTGIVTPPLNSSVSALSYLEFTASFKDRVRINSGEQFRLCILNFEFQLMGSILETYSGTTNLSVGTNSTFAVQPIADLPVGGTVNISQLLSPDMTQKDFLMNLAKMFNLYIEPYWFRVGDSNSGKYAQYLIETRDEYFTEDVIDWTPNLDLEKDFTIKPMALSKYKYYHFTYKEDNDWLNQEFKASTGRIYGDYTHFIDNDFSKETKKIEIGFSPAIVKDFYKRGRYIPAVKPNGGNKRADGKPKVLFYQGNIATPSEWRFDNDIYNTCPFSGQLDSDTAPTCDLNFKVPTLIFYGGDVEGNVTLTSSTLFNKYYYRQIFEMNDKNSKMVECYMRLRPSDIHNLSFRPLYFIKNAYYRLYEVVDHKYDDTTLCRFLKINVVNPIDNANYITKGGRGVFGTLSDKLPTKASPTEGESAGGFGTPVGTQNGGVVMGGDTSTERVSKGLLGTGILQAGTSQSVITKDNVIDFGFQYMNIASGTTELNGSEGSPLFVIVDTSAGSTVLKLPYEDLNEGKHYVIVKSSGSNTLSLTDPDDVPIETITTASTVEYILTSTQYIKLR